MPDSSNREIYGPENIKQVNWGFDLDEGPQEAINYNLKLLQDAIGGNGIYPVEGKKYKAIVIPSESPLIYKPKSRYEFVAIPLGDEMVFTPPGESEKATILTIGESRIGRGTVYRVFKYGEEDNTFKRAVGGDRVKMEQGLELSHQAADLLVNQGKLGESLKISEDAKRLITEGRQQVITKSYEIISPSILQGRGMPIGPGNISIIARGIENNLLIIEANSPFKVQVFTHEEAK